MKPVKNRQANIDFVNGLQLPSAHGVAAAAARMGKSTFLWAHGLGEKLASSAGDGTRTVDHQAPVGVHRHRRSARMDAGSSCQKLQLVLLICHAMPWHAR